MHYTIELDTGNFSDDNWYAMRDGSLWQVTSSKLANGDLFYTAVPLACVVHTRLAFGKSCYPAHVSLMLSPRVWEELFEEESFTPFDSLANSELGSLRTSLDQSSYRNAEVELETLWGRLWTDRANLGMAWENLRRCFNILPPLKIEGEDD